MKYSRLRVSVNVHRDHWGFTLIELLSVLAIVAILLAVLIPVISSVRYSAMRVENVSNIRSLGMGSLLYATDNGGTLPLTTIPGGYRSTQGHGMYRSSGAFKLLGEGFSPGEMNPTGSGYLEPNADVFYGPFTPGFNELRVPGGFYERSPLGMYIGYSFYSLPAEDAGVGGDKRDGPGPVNESLLIGDPSAPLISDLVSQGVVESAGGEAREVSVFHLDGSVSTFPKEIHELASHDRIRYMAGEDID